MAHKIVAGVLATFAALHNASHVTINLWMGIGMLVVGLVFLAWWRLKPLRPGSTEPPSAQYKTPNARRVGGEKEMRRLSEYELWYGRDVPPPPTHELHAGPVTGILDGIDLRYLSLGQMETVRRIYVGVRDQSWGTIPPVYRFTRLERTRDSFELEFDAQHTAGTVDFTWHGRVTGSADGRIEYVMDGTARSDFLYTRIGLCVLHPMNVAGQPYRAQTPDGEVSGYLPVLIGPQRREGGKLQPLFAAYTSLIIGESNGHIRFDFTGDLFEMEDQRNWTDASFKAYSTPQALGGPHQAYAGQRIRQTVTISVHGLPDAHNTDSSPRLWINSVTSRSLPPIGFGLSDHGAPLTRREIHLLRQLHPDHLRVDLHVDRDYSKTLKNALVACHEIDCALELALFIGENDRRALKALVSRLGKKPPVIRVLVFDKNAWSSQPSESTSAQLLELVRRRLSAVVPHASFVGGTNMNFCEINRTRPPRDAIDALAYSINPQVHAVDDRSVMETLEAQPETVRAAQAFCANRPIIVSPITLKPRSDAHVEVKQPPSTPIDLPSSVDARQMSLFGAAWTLGSIASLAQSGVAAMTFYETIGWKGLIEQESGPPLPELFPSVPAMVYPMYHVFADVAEWKRGRLIACRNPRPMTLSTLAVQTTSGLHLLVANLTAREQYVDIAPLTADRVFMRILDASTSLIAMFEPDRFRQNFRPAIVQSQTLRVYLAAYATVRIDAWQPQGAGMTRT